MLLGCVGQSTDITRGKVLMAGVLAMMLFDTAIVILTLWRTYEIGGYISASRSLFICIE